MVVSKLMTNGGGGTHNQGSGAWLTHIGLFALCVPVAAATLRRKKSLSGSVTGLTSENERGNANSSCFSSLAVARQKIITHNTTTVDSV